MSRGGAVGGPATLSSFRVQKAFSINFRENKRLRATLKLIEGEHMRAIRQVKQEITETKLWLEGVQENTGYSQHGIPNTERHHMFSPSSRRMSTPGSIASVERMSPRASIRPRTSQAEVMYGQVAVEPTEEIPENAAPPPHVRFAWTEQGPRKQPEAQENNKPPATAGPDTAPSIKPPSTPFGRRQSFLPKAEKPAEQQEAKEEANDQSPEDPSQLYGGAQEPKARVHSAASGKSNQSLTAYQRRRQLQSMVVKKIHPLEIKKDIHRKECVRVNSKVQDYLNNLAERMKITLPDVSLFDFDPDKHDTPFAKDVNVTE